MKNFAFLISINEYSNNIEQLKTPNNDSDLFKKSIGIYDFEIIESKNSTIQDFKNEFVGFCDFVKKSNHENDSNIIIYFAGHGISNESLEGLNGYLIFSDSQNGNINTYLPMIEFLNLINKVPFKHQLIILDCCFSGAFRKLSLRDTGNANLFEIFKQHYYHYTKNTSQQVLTSTSFNQKAIDYIGTRDEKNENSPFSTILNQALNIENLGADKVISASKIYSFIYDRLGRVTSDNYITQNASFFPLKKHENGEFLFIHKDFNPEDLNEYEYKNPYKGLKSYEVEDFQMFFGRTDIVNKIWEKLLKQQLVSIIGMSGMGKSSILKAGIGNKIKKESISYIIIRPKELNFYDPKIINSTILIIDQFEEIITDFNAVDRIKLLNGINKFLLNDETKKIILSLRIDFELPIFRNYLNNFWEDSKVYLQPLTHNQIKEIIEGPTTRVGRFFEPAIFVNDIIEEVISNPNLLPLLSFTLSELYANCIGQPYKTITKEDYLSIGGVKGGVFKCVDNLFNKLCIEERESFKRIILRMTSYTNGQISKKRIFDDELIFDDEKENYRVEKIKQLLIDNRLFTIDCINNNTFIEPSHEILILGWDKSQEWRDEFSVSNIIVIENFSIAANLYVNSSNENTEDILSKSYLWNNDPRFDIILDIDKKDPLFFNKFEKIFLEKSKEKKDVIIKKLKDDKNKAISRSISYKAQIEKERDPLKSLYMAYKANEFYPTEISYDSFSNIYIENIFDEIRTTNKRYFYKIIQNHNNENFFGLSYSEIYVINQKLEIIEEIKITQENERFSQLEINDEYNTIIVGGEKGSVIKYDINTKKIIQLFKHELAVTHISFFNNLLITCCEDSEIIIFDIENSIILNKFDGNEYIPNIVDSYGDPYFLKDSTKNKYQQIKHKDNKVQSFFIWESVMIISFRTLIITYDVAKQEIIKYIDINSHTNFIVKIIDNEGEDYSFILFLTYEGELFEYYFHDCNNNIEAYPVRKHLFSPEFNNSFSIKQIDDGYIISLGKDNGEIIFYNSSEKEEKKILGHTSKIISLCFDGNYLISNSTDNSIKKWVLEKEIFITRYEDEEITWKFMLNDNKIDSVLYVIVKYNSVWKIAFVDDYNKVITYSVDLEDEAINICISDDDELLILFKNELLILQIVRNENMFPIEINVENIKSIELDSTDIEVIKFMPKNYGGKIIFTLGNDNSINILKYQSQELDIEKIKIEPQFASKKLTPSGRGTTKPISIIPFFDGDQIIIGLWFNILLYSISNKKFQKLATDFGQLHSLFYNSIENRLLISTDRHIFSSAKFKNNLSGKENILEYSILNHELENVIFPKNLPQLNYPPKFLFYANQNKWVISISYNTLIISSISLNKIIHKITIDKIENCIKYESKNYIFIVVNTTYRLISYKIPKPTSFIARLGNDKFNNLELGINFED